MNKADFGPVLAAFREQVEERERREKRRAAWTSRPLNERESVIFDNLLYCVDKREEVSEFKTADVVADVHDYWASAEGQADLGELLYHVYEENRREARECLDRVLSVIAKIKHEQEV
jgi:hypothetical protein